MQKIIRKLPGNFAGRMSVHGARAVFKTWASEQTGYARTATPSLDDGWSLFLCGEAVASDEVVQVGKRKRTERKIYFALASLL